MLILSHTLHSHIIIANLNLLWSPIYVCGYNIPVCGEGSIFMTVMMLCVCVCVCVQMYG